MERVSWKGVLGGTGGCLCDGGICWDILVYEMCSVKEENNMKFTMNYTTY